MDNTTLLKHGYDLCALLRAALSGTAPAWEEMELSTVHRLAKMHLLSGISFMALEGTGAAQAMSPELCAAWQQEKDMAVRKYLLLNAELQQLQKALDEMGCWYLPLKGAVLAADYPKTGMRQMSDIDILFDEAYRKNVKELFLSRGYECEAYAKSNHDVYMKAPVYNFEMHVSLFGPAVPQAIGDYYRDIHRLLHPTSGMGRRFSDEDFYLYFLVHGYKHFSNSGNGLRFLLDVYVYLQKHSLDWDYVMAALQAMELTDFDTQIRTLADKLFGSAGTLTEEERELFLYCLRSGTYGLLKNSIENKIKATEADGKITLKAKVNYLLRRLFPDQQWFLIYKPFFAKWWILKPGFYIWRILRTVFRNSPKILYELQLILKLQPKEK